MASNCVSMLRFDEYNIVFKFVFLRKVKVLGRGYDHQVLLIFTIENLSFFSRYFTSVFSRLQAFKEE